MNTIRSELDRFARFRTARDDMQDTLPPFRYRKGCASRKPIIVVVMEKGLEWPSNWDPLAHWNGKTQALR